MDSFRFWSSSWNNLVKNQGKDDFKYLSQEFESNIVDLVKQKLFFPYEHMSDLEKVFEFYSLLTGKKNSD